MIEIMRLLWSLFALAVTASSVTAFAPVQKQALATRSSSALNQVATADFKATQDSNLEKLKVKDAGSNSISSDVSFYSLRLRRWFGEGDTTQTDARRSEADFQVLGTMDNGQCNSLSNRLPHRGLMKDQSWCRAAESLSRSSIPVFSDTTERIIMLLFS
jgi:hypothetical protein